MGRQALEDLLSQIRAEREQTLSALADIAEDEFSTPTDMVRWDDVRRILLRFGDHMREHANQAEAARDAIGRGHTMPQRMLAEGEIAWGKLLASTLDLSDEDMQTKPPGGGWSVEEVLQHILKSERNYREAIVKARTGPQ